MSTTSRLNAARNLSVDPSLLGATILGDTDGIDDSELTQLEALIQEEEAARGLDDLYYFDKYILGYSDMQPKTHRPVCEFLTGKSRKKHLELPRGTFKSSVCTIGYTLQRVAADPNIRVLIDNEVYANSKAFLREIKAHIERDEVRTLYPQLAPDKMQNEGWTESSVILKSRTRQSKEPTISCAGLDQIKVGMHYDLILMDDLVSNRNVTSRDQINKVIEHYKLALSLLEPDGEVVVLGTRYNYADLYGFLLKNEADTFDHLIVPAKLKSNVANQLNDRFVDITLKYGPFKSGDLLFPERHSEEFLREQRRSQGAYIYNCQYLLDPVDSESADFRREWFRYHRSHVEVNPDSGKPVLVVSWVGDYHKQTLEGYEFPLHLPITKLVTVDPNNKKKKDSDYTAGMVVAVTDNNDWFIIDMERDILNPGQIVRKILDLQECYEPEILGLEEVGKEAIQYMRGQEMRDNNRFFRIVELTTKGVHKEDRIKRLVPRLEYGTIYLPPSLVKKNSYGAVVDLTEALEDEFMYFPSGEHDDLIDALAYVEDLVDLIRRRNKAKKRRAGNAKSVSPKSNLPRNRAKTVQYYKEENVI